MGSLAGVPGQLCLKSFFDTRTCKPSIFYNFRLACRGGTASAPQLFMALFGNDQSTQKNGFALSGDQLSYIDPVRDFSGQSGRRVYLPPGYAPLNTTNINSFIKQLTWDDYAMRPALSETLTDDQERRIKQLFVAQSGYIEPFPESSIRRAFQIAEEKPAPAPAVSAQVAGRSQFSVPANSYAALTGSLIFAAFLSWVFGVVTRKLSSERPHFWRQVGIESIGMVISGIILYWLGIVDEIKLLSIPLAGGLSIAVVSSVRS